MTRTRGPETCAFPPHPADDQDDNRGAPAPSAALGRFGGWLRHAPAERIPPVAAPVVWTAAEIVHAAGVPALIPGAATVAAAALADRIGERRQRRDPGTARLGGAELAAVTGATGAWVTASAMWGPLAGPFDLLSVAYLAGACGGYWWLRSHKALKDARARRDAAAGWEDRKADWHRLAPRLGLGGSHLLAETKTLLGEERLIDVRGTGRRASQIAGRDLAERIGEIEMLPVGRIDVRADKIPGRIRIAIRRTDPWAHPVAHPLTVRESPYARHVPYPATIREPLTIGADPETGRPLRVRLWDAKGGKVILIAGKKDAGKTVLLNDLTERITACPDAALLQVNLSKSMEDEIWAPLAEANGLDKAARARRILQFVLDVIVTRPKPGPHRRRTPVHQPTPAEPLYVLKIDEIDAVAELPDVQVMLRKISSKCRSEGVALIIAGQRAVAKWMGGADVRANVDIAIWGKFARAGEARHVAGQEVELPDMGAYGEGASGVFGITELGGSGDYDKGRTFYLHDIDDLERIVAERLAARPVRDLEPALASLAAAWVKITDGDGDGEAGTGAPVGPWDDGTDEADDEDQADDEEGYDPSPIAAKVAAARAAGTSPAGIPPIPPGMEAHAAASLAERRRQFEAAYTDIALPEADQATLRAMLARPGGISTRAAAAALPWSHTRVHQQLTRWKHEGQAELRGRGSARRWHLAGPGGGAQPPLRAVTGDGDDSPAEAAS